MVRPARKTEFGTAGKSSYTPGRTLRISNSPAARLSAETAFTKVLGEKLSMRCDSTGVRINEANPLSTTPAGDCDGAGFAANPEILRNVTGADRSEKSTPGASLVFRLNRVACVGSETPGKNVRTRGFCPAGVTMFGGGVTPT